MQKELPVRKKIRLQGYDYSQAGYYFITVCVQNGHEMLGKVVGNAALGVPYIELTDIGEIVKQYIENINIVYNGEIRVDNYVIMPNHIHMIITIYKNETSNCKDGTPRAAFPTKAKIPKVVNSLKGLTTKKIGFSIWQDRYHDRIIRDKTEYQNKCRYIDENPAKWAEDRYFVKEVSNEQ